MTAQVETKEIGSLILENIPEIPGALSQRLNHYQNTREVSLMDWMKEPDGLLVSTRFGEADQLHLVHQPGGARRQITFFKEPITNARVCPDPNKKGFLFMKDVGGDENHQIYYFDIQKGKYDLLTDGFSKHGFGLWNRQGNCIVYNSTKRNQVDHDLYVYDIEQRKERLILAEGGYWLPIDWSPDDQYITAIHYRSVNQSALYVIDVSEGTSSVLIDKLQVACTGGYWMPDGKSIFFASDEYGECRVLMKYDLTTSTYKVLPLNGDCEIEMIRLSPDGKKLVVVYNEDGYSKLYLFDTQTEGNQRINDLPKGVVSHLCWHPDEHKLGLSINRPNAPADAYVLDFEQNDIQRWTYSEVGGLNPENFIEPSLIHYPTFDKKLEKQRHIPAYYYRPDHSKEGPSPVLIYIHGGPESQYRPVFSPAFQYYLKELNIAVVAPNVRGSTGYGKSYLRLDDGYKREDSVRDIGKLLDWIDSRTELDNQRVAVIGGSYGGYMVLSSMAHFNDRLSCGIDVVGISNFVTFLKNTKSYRRSLRRVEYGDERDPAMRRHLERISPTSNAHKITKPMLIVQGLNDPRVPASEAEQMLKAIRKNGGEAWYLLAKDEGHGFRKKGNRDFYNKAVIMFLQQFLLD